MIFSEAFRNKMQAMGSNKTERMMRRATRDFDIFFENAPNKEDCLIDGEETSAVFQDQSQSNNKDLSDDKYVIVPNSQKISVGSYIVWRSSEWLVFTGENKTVPTHQQVKIKNVNSVLKWVTDYETHSICNNGNGWGAYVQNNTLYTLGVSFSGNHFPIVDGKMTVFVQSNEETKKGLKIGTRIVLGQSVYRIEFADFVSRKGLINLLCDQDTVNDETDNIALGVANYWLSSEHHGAKVAESEKEDNATNPTPEAEPSNNNQPKIDWYIKGNNVAKIGRSYNFELAYKDTDGTEKPVKATEWILSDADDLPFYVLEKDETTLNVRVKDDRRYVGQTTSVMAKVNGEIKSLAVRIANKF